MNRKSGDLTNKINRLIKQNYELKGLNETLTRQVRTLLDENDSLKRIIEDWENDKNLLTQNSSDAVSTRYRMATIMYADIQGFDKMSERTDSSELIDQLDHILDQFDKIIELHRIQKIKSIGHSLMCAGGIPLKNITNPIDVVLAAIKMQQILNSFDKINQQKVWEMRIGIHTGPVTALSNIKKNYTYELKGESVNITTRLEASSQLGNIIVSDLTMEMVKEFFNFEYWGKMPVKYKGDIEMYRITGIKEVYSVDKEGILTNKKFEVKYKLRQFTDLQEIILDKLEKELPSFLYYHNVRHTVDVVTEVELLGVAEGLNEEELLLIKTAALFHDAGHTIGYDNHEHHGTVLAKKMLPAFNYTHEEIEIICGIIMATKLPPKPKNLMEQIICDADLDYLGRTDFMPVSNTLFDELKEQNKISNINEWNKLQVKFITNHQYFTETARGKREVNKQKQIDRIKLLIDTDTNQQ